MIREKIRRIDFSPDEWIAGTVGMTLEEEGLYIRIVARYYSRGEAPPSSDAEVARLCGVRPQVVRRLMPKLREKFDETGGKLRQNRCETELKLARNRQETYRINASKARDRKGLAEAVQSAPTRARVPSTINHHISEEKKTPATAGEKESTEPAAPLRGDTILSANGKSHDRGTRLALDWEPSDADCQFAIAAGLDPSAIAAEFRDYWIGVPGQRGRKIDWSATFRNSCRKTAERKRPNGDGPGGSSILAAVSAIRY